MALSSMIDFRLPRIEDIEEIAPGHPVYRISFNDCAVDTSGKMKRTTKLSTADRDFY